MGDEEHERLAPAHTAKRLQTCHEHGECMIWRTPWSRRLRPTLRVAVHEAPPEQRPLSLQRYVDGVLDHLAGHRIEIARYSADTPTPGEVDLYWDPWCGWPMGPCLPDSTHIAKVVTFHGGAPWSLDPNEFWGSAALARLRSAEVEHQRAHWRRWLPRLSVVTPSDFGRAELIDALGVEPRQGITIHHGVTRQRCCCRSRPARVAVLSISSPQPLKNHQRLVDAYLALPAELRGGLRLIVPGLPRPTPWPADIELVAEALTERELACHFQNATIFALPSLRESFGLPVLEAMAHHCAALTSRGSALEELYSSAAVLVDARSVQSINQGLQELLTSPRLRAKKIRAGRELASRLTWEASAAAHARFFFRLAERRP
jgi:glycosyltransferase involved in cell wall biosynthesis